MPFIPAASNDRKPQKFGHDLEAIIERWNNISQNYH